MDHIFLGMPMKESIGAREGMEIGGVFALATELEYEVAKKISSMVPSAELVRYSNSGTEVVMADSRWASG